MAETKKAAYTAKVEVPRSEKVCPKREELVEKILANAWLDSERPDADTDPGYLKRKPRKKKKG